MPPSEVHIATDDVVVGMSFLLLLTTVCVRFLCGLLCPRAVGGSKARSKDEKALARRNRRPPEEREHGATNGAVNDRANGRAEVMANADDSDDAMETTSMVSVAAV